MYPIDGMSCGVSVREVTSFALPNKTCEVREAIGKSVIDIGPNDGCRHDLYYDYFALDIVSYTPHWVAFCSHDKMIMATQWFGAIRSRLSIRYTYESCRRSYDRKASNPRWSTSLYFMSDHNASIVLDVYGWTIPDCSDASVLRMGGMIVVVLLMIVM